MRSITATLTALLALASAPDSRADYYVVVSNESAVMQLSQKDVLHLFMGRSRTFPDGSLAVPHDLEGNAHREGFYRSLSGMSLSQVTSYWARLMFSGRSLPPERVSNEGAMIRQLLANPSAIGWLPAPPSEHGVRTVLILREAP
jgi:hypothetical protein